MTKILYHGEPNGPSLTVLAAAFETNVDVTLRRIDLVSGERHSGAVPQAMEVEHSIEGEGPVLVVGGVPMTDSVFIACYLDDIGAGQKLRPDDPYRRWETMAWCRWAIERLAPAAAYLGVRSSPPAGVPAGIASIDLAARWSEAANGRFDEAKTADSQAKIIQAVEKIENQLGDGREWIMGDFGVADLETYAWLAGMPKLTPDAFADRPRTAAWLERTKARPSVARALATATVAAPERVWAPGPEINRWG